MKVPWIPPYADGALSGFILAEGLLMVLDENSLGWLLIFLSVFRAAVRAAMPADLDAFLSRRNGGEGR